jgi:ATP-dependent DNA helicase RecG
VLRLQDGADELVLRFLHFYPTQQKTWSPGKLLRVRGELRDGFFGREMVHPAVRVVEESTPLPQALTPVYPASAQLPQAYLRKAVASALGRADLSELLPPATLPAGLPPLREALAFLHHPPPDTPLAELEDRSHPAWLRIKFDELLAQQLSQALARSTGARRWARCSRASSRCTGCCKAMSAPARPWWPPLPRPPPSTPAGNVP